MPIYIEDQSVVCEFGHGDIGFAGKTSDPEKDGLPQSYAIFLWNINPGEVGRTTNGEFDKESTPQTKITFMNVESLRVVHEAFSVLLAYAESVQVQPEAIAPVPVSP